MILLNCVAGGLMCGLVDGVIEAATEEAAADLAFDLNFAELLLPVEKFNLDSQRRFARIAQAPIIQRLNWLPGWKPINR